MPAHLLGKAVIAAPVYSVIGKSTPAGVSHAAILCLAGPLSEGAQPNVFDCAPPLRVGCRDQEPSAEASCPGGDACHLVSGWDQPCEAHAVGWLSDLKDSEQEQMHLWLHEIQTMLFKRPGNWVAEYIVHPSWEEVLDPVTNRLQGIRCSCAGFVIRLYQKGGVELLDQEALPALPMEVVAEIWPSVAELVRSPKLAGRFGLTAPPPWRLLLPGYLLHALARESRLPPYQPKADDRRFPLEGLRTT